MFSECLANFDLYANFQSLCIFVVLVLAGKLSDHFLSYVVGIKIVNISFESCLDEKQSIPRRREM
jgi:hypothetical protein